MSAATAGIPDADLGGATQHVTSKRDGWQQIIKACRYHPEEFLNWASEGNMIFSAVTDYTINANVIQQTAASVLKAEAPVVELKSGSAKLTLSNGSLSLDYTDFYINGVKQ